MEKQDQGGAGSSGGAGGSSSQNQINSGGSSLHTTSLDEKKQRIHHNIALAEFFKNRYMGNGTDPYDLLNKLKDLHLSTQKTNESMFQQPADPKVQVY